MSNIRARKRHLEMRIAKSKNVFNSVATIDVGNLSLSLHKKDVASRKSNDFRSRASSGEMSAISDLGALTEDEED